MEMLLRARSVPGFCWGSSCGILTLTIRGIGTVEICISQMRKQAPGSSPGQCLLGCVLDPWGTWHIPRLAKHWALVLGFGGGGPWELVACPSLSWQDSECQAPQVCNRAQGDLMWAGPVQDAENLLVGAPSGDPQGPLTPLAQQDGLSAPHEPVEVMVFPGLCLSREAFLTTAEFGTQELRRPAQLRLQVYRLLSTAGTPENGSEPESRSPDNRTQLAPACMPGGRWCPGANICLPLDASCHPQACANGCTSGPGLPGAPYALWREFLFSVPAGPPAQCSVCGPDLGLFPASPQATFLSAARGLGLLTRHTQPAGPSHVLATSDLRPPTSDLCGALAPLPVGEALAWALGTSCAASSSLPAQLLLPVCQVLACVLSPCVPLSATVLPVLVPSTVGRLPEVWLTKRGALRVHPHPSCRGPRAMTVRT
nr:polycystin-1-like isoform X1 [Pan paniscus]